jgi:hypothetical protein
MRPSATSEYGALSYKCSWPLRLDLEAEDNAEEMRAVNVEEEATAALR